MKKKQIDFDSVIMPSEKKAQINAAISQLKNHNKIFKDWGFEEVFEKGTAISMIFYGIPGTGKTLMAEAIANKLNRELLTISPAEIETQVPGGADYVKLKAIEKWNGTVPTQMIPGSTVPFINLNN